MIAFTDVSVSHVYILLSSDVHSGEKTELKTKQNNIIKKRKFPKFPKMKKYKERNFQVGNIEFY